MGKKTLSKTIRLSEKEMAIVKARAVELDITEGEYIRRLILKDGRRKA